MKKIMFLTIILFVLAGIASTSYAEFKRFNVYTDKTSRDNHYVPSGWMGDVGDLKLDTGWKEKPHSGDTCMKITYTAQQRQGAGWAGIFWQNPPNNWGNKPGGYDLTGATKVVFWARGEKGGEMLAKTCVGGAVLSEVKAGGIQGEYSDSDSVSIGPITLTPEWKEYCIDLKGKDVSYISGGFAFVASAADNSEGFTIYIDDVYYE